MFSLIKKIIITMEKVPIIPLVVLATVVMMFFQALFSKLMQMLLTKIQFLVWDRNFLLKVIWQLCFILVSSMVIIVMIDGSLADLLLPPFVGNIDLEKELAFCKSHKKVDVSGVKSAFIMHTGYFAANTIFGLINQSYKTLEFLRMEIMFAIIMLTFYSKCPLYGMCILLISHQSSLLENVSKLCILIGRHTDSELLATFSVGFFAYHCAMWLAAFIIEMPMFLSTNKTIDSSMMFAELNLLIITHGLVVAYVIVSFFEGPFTRMVHAYVSHAPDGEKNLIFFLFGTNLAHRRTCSVTQSYRRDTSRRQSRALMQIIRRIDDDSS
uniref:Uncharacterized protein n=1 Tax=Cuerna arida TaxID=1464854 RepID=A0A1B6FFW0_9HEMI